MCLLNGYQKTIKLSQLSSREKSGLVLPSEGSFQLNLVFLLLFLTQWEPERSRTLEVQPWPKDQKRLSLDKPRQMGQTAIYKHSIREVRPLLFPKSCLNYTAVLV